MVDVTFRSETTPTVLRRLIDNYPRSFKGPSETGRYGCGSAAGKANFEQASGDLARAGKMNSMATGDGKPLPASADGKEPDDPVPSQH